MRGTKEKTTSSSVGLNTAEVLQSRREHGENILSRQKRKSFLRQFLGNLNDPVIRILLAALAIHLLLLFGNGDLGETIGIGVAVFLATLISTLSEYGSARAFERLEQDAGGILCRVRRDGTVVQIPIREVVVGDTVLLSAGDAIPADGRMLLGALSADQSAMTGESREVRKYPMDDASSMTPLFVFSWRLLQSTCSFCLATVTLARPSALVWQSFLQRLSLLFRSTAPHAPLSVWSRMQAAFFAVSAVAERSCKSPFARWL